MSFVVAVDGPAGTGKGTITKLVAEKLGLLVVDTGAMYRCVTLKVLRDKVLPENEEKIKEIMDNISIDMKEIDGKQKVYLNGEDVTEEIRTPEIDKNVSVICAIPYVREKITPLQRKMGENTDIIMEGRDIGTVVFPNADVKIYLTAKASRRCNTIRYNKNVYKASRKKNNKNNK